MPGFQDCVSEAWSKEVPSRHDPLMALHIKLNRVANALSAWAKTLVSQGRLAMTICKEVIQRLKEAQEHRQLAERERFLVKQLKARVLGLATVQKSQARQKSRLTWLKKGNANTRYFQIMAIVRKKKNFIHALHSDDWVAWSHRDRGKVIYDHFLQHLGSYVPRKCRLNLANLGWQPKSLVHLEADVTESELQNVILNAPKEKAPRPDGFIGLFFSIC
jgi:hypothetical protein